MAIQHTALGGMLVALSTIVALPPAVAQTATDSGQGKSDQQGTAKNFKEAYAAVKNYSYAKRDEFVKWADARMAQLDAGMKRLQEQVAEAGAGAKARMGKEMGDLRKQRKELGVRADKLRKSSAEAWEGAKQDFAAVMDKVEQAYKNAQAKFIKEAPPEKAKNGG